MLAAYDCFGDWDFFNLGFLAEKLLGRRTKRYDEVVRRDQTFFDLPLQDMTTRSQFSQYDAEGQRIEHPLLLHSPESRNLGDG